MLADGPRKDLREFKDRCGDLAKPIKRGQPACGFGDMPVARLGLGQKILGAGHRRNWVHLCFSETKLRPRRTRPAGRLSSGDAVGLHSAVGVVLCLNRSPPGAGLAALLAPQCAGAGTGAAASRSALISATFFSTNSTRWSTMSASFSRWSATPRI